MAQKALPPADDPALCRARHAALCHTVVSIFATGSYRMKEWIVSHTHFAPVAEAPVVEAAPAEAAPAEEAVAQ